MSLLGLDHARFTNTTFLDCTAVGTGAFVNGGALQAMWVAGLAGVWGGFGGKVPGMRWVVWGMGDPTET